MMWNTCFHCGEQINESNSYHIVSGMVTQMNREMDNTMYHTYSGSIGVMGTGGIRTTMEFVSSVGDAENIIKSFHRKCWLEVAGEEFL